MTNRVQIYSNSKIPHCKALSSFSISSEYKDNQKLSAAINCKSPPINLYKKNSAIKLTTETSLKFKPRITKSNLILPIHMGNFDDISKNSIIKQHHRVSTSSTFVSVLNQRNYWKPNIVINNHKNIKRLNETASIENRIKSMNEKLIETNNQIRWLSMSQSPKNLLNLLPYKEEIKRLKENKEGLSKYDIEKQLIGAIVDMELKKHCMRSPEKMNCTKNPLRNYLTRKNLGFLLNMYSKSPKPQIMTYKIPEKITNKKISFNNDPKIGIAPNKIKHNSIVNIKKFNSKYLYD